MLTSRHRILSLAQRTSAPLRTCTRIPSALSTERLSVRIPAAPPRRSTAALETVYSEVARQGGNEFLVLSAGELVNVNSTITAGESIIRRMALVVPADLPFVVMKAVVVVTHTQEASQNIVWNWSFQPDSLDLFVVPWHSDDLQTYQDLRDCVAAGDTRGEDCRSEAKAKARQALGEVTGRDRYEYMQLHTHEAFAWKEKMKR